MDLEATYTYLAQKKGAVEEFPFGPQALVFKVMGKMFALVVKGLKKADRERLFD